MNNDERHTMREEARMPEPEQIRCECCNNLLNDYETADPCTIDYHTFCDSCAQNLTSLRLQGFIKSVADRTNVIRDKEHRDEMWGMGFQLVKFGTVKHI